MNVKRILIILIAVGLLAGLYVYGFVLNKAHPDFAGLEADFTVNAGDIYNEFKSDAGAASAKYNGKMVLIKGNADKLEITDSLTIAVFVFSEGMFGDEGLRCTFLPSVKISSAEQLKDKDIKCFCSGFNETDVIFQKCSTAN